MIDEYKEIKDEIEKENDINDEQEYINKQNINKRNKNINIYH